VEEGHPELASYTGYLEQQVQLFSRALTWRTGSDVHSDKTNFYYLVVR
jgi:hypothetical protein